MNTAEILQIFKAMKSSQMRRLDLPVDYVQLMRSMQQSSSRTKSFYTHLMNLVVTLSKHYFLVHHVTTDYDHSRDWYSQNNIHYTKLALQSNGKLPTIRK